MKSDSVLERYLPNETTTLMLGAECAVTLAAGQLIFLRGPLGAGKTTFVRGLLRALGHSGPVRSPTYTLVEDYAVGQFILHHFDLYRLGDPEELEYMGIRDFFDGQAINLVEWPEHGVNLLPAPDIDLELSPQFPGRLARLRKLSKPA